MTCTRFSLLAMAAAVTWGAGGAHEVSRVVKASGGVDYVQASRVSFKPPGTEDAILNNVSLSLPRKSLGLIYGRSGSGKTTLLQILAGLASPTKGSVVIGDESTFEQGSLTERVGLVFQFPERYFLTDSVIQELTFGWSRRTDDFFSRQMLAMRVQAAVSAVGLASIPWDTNPRALSDGYKRRLALAVQLVRMPELLLLDEPLAGLDWQARTDVVKLLLALKKERTLIVVSHDLRELMPIVDRAWRMEMGVESIKSFTDASRHLPFVTWLYRISNEERNQHHFFLLAELQGFLPCDREQAGTIRH